MSTVHRILRRLAEYGHVRPARIGRPDITTLLTRAQLLVFMEHVLNNPTSYLREIEQYLIDSTGGSSNLIGLHRILRHNGYSYKRVSVLIHKTIGKGSWKNEFVNFTFTTLTQVKKIALRKNLVLRREYQETIAVFRAEEFVFLDEYFLVSILLTTIQ